MPPRIDIPPAAQAEAKCLYEETFTSILEICRLMKISRSTFYRLRDENNWMRRRYSTTLGYSGLLPAASDEATAPAAAVAPEQPAALAVRVYQAMQRQMDAIETIQKTLNPQQEIQSERTVRILAVLNRALREIAMITKFDETTFLDAADNDPVPHDLDQFRRELARRIRGLVDAERSRPGESPDRPSDALAR